MRRRKELALEASRIGGFESYAGFTSVDAARNRFRFYNLIWQPALWEGGAILRHWGRLGSRGRWAEEVYPDRASAQERTEGIVRRRLRHGYEVVEWD